MRNKSKLFVALALVTLLLMSVPMAVVVSDADSSSSNDTYSSDIGYKSLKDEKDRSAYVNFGNGIDKVEKTVSTEMIKLYDESNPVSKDKIQSITEIYMSDHPDKFWASYYTYYEPVVEGDDHYYAVGVSDETYKLVKNKDLTKMKSDLSEKINAISKSDSKASMYDRVKYLQKAVNERTTYVNDPNNPDCGNVYGVFCDSKSKCDGYSLAFALLCHRENIPCVVIDGFVKSEKETNGHAWNAVQMDDKKWYYVDTTWDDYKDNITYLYFLIGSQTVVEGETFEKTRTVDYDYGISVSKDKYNNASPSSSDNNTAIIIVVVVIVIIILAILAWYYFKKRNGGVSQTVNVEDGKNPPQQ